MNSKTIILSSKENSTSRAILSLYIEDELLKCKIRLYNTNKLNATTKIGIYHNDQVYKANLLEKYGTYESSFVGDFDLNNDFYCAIIDTNNNVILSGGTYSGYFFSNTELFNTTDEETEEIIDCEIDKCDEYEKCKTCKYKQFFYDNQENSEENNSLSNQSLTNETKLTTQDIQTYAEIKNIDNTEILTEPPKTENNNTKTPANKIEKQEVPKNFLSSIIPQFKYIFDNYPQDQELNTLLENAKFVKINENNEQYSIGTINENDTIKYICYAVKCNYNTPAPIEIGEHYQWLPLDKDDPLSEGYYIVFQDAIDLKILEI